MKQPKPRDNTIRDGHYRPTLWLGVLLVPILLATARDGAGGDWMSTAARDGVWNAPADAGQPARLPPIETVSYEATAMLEPSDSLPAHAGYDGGFVIANHGLDSVSATDFPFFLRVNSWVQLRHTWFDSGEHQEDLNLFSIERLRLSLGGHAYSPHLRYFFQFDGNSDQASEAIFLDYFVSYDLGCDLLGCTAGKVGVKAGKWKVPFSRSREESGRRLQFNERTTANLFFDLNRSIGVGLFGELDAWTAPVRWELAIFNGFQTGAETNIRDAGLDQNFAWSARMSTDLLGEFGGDGEPDLSWHAEPALRFGCGFAATRVDAIGTNEFAQPRVIDSGERLADLLNASGADVSAYDAGLYTVDAHGKFRGCSVIAEYYWRCVGNFRGGDISGLSDHGFNLQIGQFVVPEKLELLARWSRIAGNSGTLGLMRQSTDELGLGVAWYLKGHNAKLVLDASRMNGMPVSSPRLDILPGSEGWLMRTQLQFGF
jgi:hypothetical protein